MRDDLRARAAVICDRAAASGRTLTETMREMFTDTCIPDVLAAWSLAVDAHHASRGEDYGARCRSARALILSGWAPATG